ncbi:mannitol dehydrogenase family protein [Acuticoccus sp. MNP-M23]|uniref:mannitol dehydrogenase family protein n=1 Tax=Acuticoccus sp. MNP-M23 TaxID=3072793 RepID=UPI0028158BEA|nr:mannitol dehydrogenase family protein [Acuticoccus sp. MNP-M23]WMS40758.1 mannitol dehydrogenase family protein [Acuticoccus sp. MNP-M23]
MDELTTLSNDSLNRLPANVARPRYDRAALSHGIVHIGLGNFHRAHQSWYLHRLMQDGHAHDFAIVGAGVRPADSAMRDKLLAQDGLTTLIELDPTGMGAEVVGAMIDFCPIAADNAPLVAALADPATRIASLTVTEGGYYQDAAGHSLDGSHADIRHDAASPERPRTAFGAIVAALKQRRANGQPAFTVQSCDNLQGNGAIARQTVTGLARLSDPALADWIEQNVSFPNAMVDCIVPATGPHEIALARQFGIADAAPVTHENFRQWVMEDDFCAGRPPWELAGATFTSDVHAYEIMKLRVLNAGHQIIANPGELLSLDTIADCMASEAVRTYFAKVAETEILPHVDPVPEMTPQAYFQQTRTRFSNTAIGDTTRRVAFDGSSRHAGFVLPTVRERLAAGGAVDGLALVEALWARMARGTREDGTEIAANDPDWDRLVAVAKAARARPEAWLDQNPFYGDLKDAEAFVQPFCRWMRFIDENGTEAALAHYSA